ncbi:VOC family protein [Luteimonas sp. SX5]|uniref:VOC family protein n=1 Tax=Luteimonas galliterrae TaxID=2940486 RepID=A0ABT0MMJ3_9GAMM|nr:VOC family protein [Luteimonas galliterrae]MCL1635449.1 VOC family protein [Luteimonas galliterrae]
MRLRIDGMAPLLQVFDMPASLAFYRDILGFERVDDSGNGDGSDWVWLRLDGVDLMLNTAYEADDRPASPDSARIAAHRDTGLFFGCGDVDAAYAYLLSRGLHPEPPKVQSYGMKHAVCRRPGRIPTVFPAFRLKTRFLAGPAFAPTKSPQRGRISAPLP